MKRAIVINPRDNVAVALVPLQMGELACGVTLAEDIPAGHKFALRGIKKGAIVTKYGNAIGRAAQDIKAGQHVHTHNAGTMLDQHREYTFDKEAVQADALADSEEITVNVFPRADGGVGIRNELWVVPTVGCVNAVAQRIVKQFNLRCDTSAVDGVHAFVHPYGCSQLGCDHERTQRLLAGIIRHPNAGGVLVLGLGCENNQINGLRELLDGADESRIRYLVAQDVDDEIEAGTALLTELYERARRDRREQRCISCLKIGLKCGGSDGLSGVTANPLLGLFSDQLIGRGGSAVLTEVPEMFGAEHLLMNRAANEEVFRKIVDMINGFKSYYTEAGLPVYENPSPGNKAGGITTLEDKSLGCTQKSGSSEVVDVLYEGDCVSKAGLSLLNGPGNDPVAVTNLGAAGCHMVLFTTGRGTPFGGFVPTVKVATNDRIYNAKQSWMDFNAGAVLSEGFENVLREFIRLVVNTANGAATKNELNDCREVAIFKTGVTL